jgi:pimeloyl-ACP methyl ester carboxylesterase
MMVLGRHLGNTALKNCGSLTTISMVCFFDKNLQSIGIPANCFSSGTIWDSREVYRLWDPLRFAKKFATPQFVIHNDLDFRLPISEGLTMFNALQELGVPSRFLHFPDEGHWVLNQENSLFWHTEIYNWINYWSGKISSLDDNAITE